MTSETFTVREVVHGEVRSHEIAWSDVGRVQYLPEVIILGFKNRKMMIDTKGNVTFGTLIRGMTLDRFEEDGEGTTDPMVYSEAWLRFPNATPASDRV